MDTLAEFDLILGVLVLCVLGLSIFLFGFYLGKWRAVRAIFKDTEGLEEDIKALVASEVAKRQ